MSDAPESTRTAFAFPGVGVPLCGSEAAFFARHRSLMAPALEAASGTADADLIASLAGGAIPPLDHRATELFTYAFNCGAFAVFTHLGLNPFCMAGNSLGVHSTLAASGALSFTDGLAVVDAAHTLVWETCPEGRFGMAVVVGLSDRDILPLLHADAHASVCLVNSNSPTAKVLAGERGELETFLAQAESLGALKAVLLDIEIPFHHPRFMRPASDAFLTFLKTLSWNRPVCPIISSIDNSLLRHPDPLIDFAARSLSSPIHWERVVQTFIDLGVETVIECGPGISLTQNARFIEGAPAHINLKTARRRLGH